MIDKEKVTKPIKDLHALAALTTNDIEKFQGSLEEFMEKNGLGPEDMENDCKPVD